MAYHGFISLQISLHQDDLTAQYDCMQILKLHNIGR